MKIYITQEEFDRVNVPGGPTFYAEAILDIDHKEYLAKDHAMNTHTQEVGVDISIKAVKAGLFPDCRVDI